MLSAAQPAPWRFLPVLPGAMGSGRVVAVRWTRSPDLALSEECFSNADGSWRIFDDEDEAHAAIAQAEKGGAA